MNAVSNVQAQRFASFPVPTTTPAAPVAQLASLDAISAPSTFAGVQAEALRTSMKALSGEAPATDLTLTLNGLAAALDHFNFKGHGDVDYWMKTVANHARHAHAMGRAVQTMAADVNDDLTRSHLNSIASQLLDVSSGGRGDVDYWVSRDAEIARVVRSAASQLRSVHNGGEQISLKRSLVALANAASAANDKGYGDIDYWMRVSSDLATYGRSIGVALQRIANAAEQPHRGVVSSLASQFLNLSSAGRGDLDYWVSRAAGLERRIHSLRDSLVEIARAIPSAG